MIALPLKLVLRYIASVMILGIIVFTFISLITFSMHDTSLFFTDTVPTPLKNWGGWVGAYHASALLYFFGMSVFFLLPILTLCIMTIIGAYSWAQVSDRIVGLTIVLFSHAAFCSHIDYEICDGVPAGGVVGAGLKRLVGGMFGKNDGEWYVLIACMWIASVLIFHFSWSRRCAIFLHQITRLAFMGVSSRLKKYSHQTADCVLLNNLSIEELIKQTRYIQNDSDMFYSDPLWHTISITKKSIKPESSDSPMVAKSNHVKKITSRSLQLFSFSESSYFQRYYNKNNEKKSECKKK